MKNEYILGIDIGGTNFRIGLVNNKYEIIDFNMKSISELKKGDFIILFHAFVFTIFSDRLSFSHNKNSFFINL